MSKDIVHLFLLAWILFFAAAAFADLGQPACPEIQVGDDRTLQRGYGDVIIVPNGEIVAGYSENVEAYIQRLGPSGEILEGRMSADPHGPHGPGFGAAGTLLAPGEEGNFLASWTLLGPSWYLQGFDSNDERLGEPRDLTTYLPGPEGGPCNDPGVPVIRYSGDGKFIIGWMQCFCEAPGHTSWWGGLWFRKYDIQGNQVSGAVSIPGSYQTCGTCDWIGYGKSLLGLAALPDGGFIAVWIERHYDDGQGRDSDEYLVVSAQRFTGDLVSVGETIVIRTDNYGEYHIADVAADSEGNFVIVWDDLEYELWGGIFWPWTSVVYAQRFDAQGERIGDRILVDRRSAPLYGRRYTRIAMDSAGNFVITWKGYAGGRFDKDGNRVGPTFKISLDGAPESGEGCRVDMDDSGKMAFLYPQDWIGEVDPEDLPSGYLTNIFLRVIDFDAHAFLRGDVNGDERLDISDPIAAILYLFAQEPVSFLEAADANDDEAVDLSDPIYLLSYLFRGDPEGLPHPFPMPGFDPTP